MYWDSGELLIEYFVGVIDFGCTFSLSGASKQNELCFLCQLDGLILYKCMGSSWPK